MPKRKLVKIDEKTLLYRLCSLLREKRLNTKGKNTPVFISKKEFMTELRQYAGDSTLDEKWANIITELNSLIKYEENTNGRKLIRFINQKSITNFKQATDEKKFIFQYKLEDIEEYTDGLLSGDSKRNNIRSGQIKNVPSTKTFKIIKGCLVYNKLSIPVEDKQEKIAKLFLDNAKIHKKGRTAKEGSPLLLEDIMEKVGYDSEKDARTGKKELKTKINKKWEKSQIEIKNVGLKLFQLIINY